MDGFCAGFLALEQVSNADAERASNLVNVVDADVSGATFDAADIRPIEVRLMREVFLRPTALVAQLPEAVAKCATMPWNTHTSTVGVR